MTAKDAVKCQQFALDNLWQVPVEAQLPPQFYATLNQKLQFILSRTSC
jgi:tetraacyldisaccharide-1-P 4'-kinase